ncbi:endonuclease domain-containing protein [Nocardioides sp.]|uniref:endonuclease domain-containing protein n=1 Tax=Nocardioides sp. TaxID=35761 RepID=UPI002720F1CA|nr:DUF559 domain-containing protein [Nocardioides sp.]MDO9455144.1 DUF559 domain-containing protein [Nocardioides sp.]
MSEESTPDKVDLDRPFTRATLKAVGLDASMLRPPEYVRVLPWVWSRKATVNALTLIRAALLIHPSAAYASFVSAAIVLGLPVPDPPFVHVTVTKHKDRRFRPQIKAHVTDRKQPVIEVDGIRTTDPVATFIDCAGLLGLVDLVVLGDALVKKYRIEPAALVAACQKSTDYYANLALIAACFVRKGVDSPMETRLRMLIVLAGLPEPVVNYKIYNDDGTWRRRFDLCYPGIKLIVEYDGLHHAEPDNREKDLERREEFDDEGYRIIVVTARGIYRTPEKTLQRVRRQLVERGMSDVPEIDDRWQEYFGA